MMAMGLLQAQHVPLPPTMLPAAVESDEEAVAPGRRIVLVTGGTEGVGAAVSRKLKRLGYVVAATYTNAHQARAWQNALAKDGYLFHIYPCDLTDISAAQRLVNRVAVDLGPLDTLVNAAGNAVGACARDSAFSITCAALDDMMAQGFGRIINVSFADLPGAEAPGRGLHDLTWEIAAETIKRGVTINTVSIDSFAGPRGPEDVADIVAFLAARDSGYVNGVNIPVNAQQTEGGYCHESHA